MIWIIWKHFLKPIPFFSSSPFMWIIIFKTSDAEMTEISHVSWAGGLLLFHACDLFSLPVLIQLWPGLPSASDLLQWGACGEWQLWVQPSVFVQLSRDSPCELHAMQFGPLPASTGVEGWNLGSGEKIVILNVVQSLISRVSGWKRNT